MRPLTGQTICYVSPADFSGWTRTYREAVAVAEAGARVCFVGWDELMPRAFTDSPFDSVPVTHVEMPSVRTSRSRSYVMRTLMNRTVNRVLNGRILRARTSLAIRRDRAHLIRAIRATGATIVQAVDLPALEIAEDAARLLGAKLTYDSHEYWTGFLTNPVWDQAREWGERLLELEAEIIKRVDLVIAVSDPMGSRIADRYGVPQPLTILNSPFTHVESAKPLSDPVRLVFHGGLSSDRNIDGLIRAMVPLVDRATLDIHGFNRTTNRSSLEGLIQELGLEATVKLHGPFEYQEVVDLISDYDVGVMAAKVSEENFEVTIPNKVYDCMCAGLAMAMYDSEGIRSALAEVDYGVTIDSTSPESIARDLSRMLDDPARIARMKATAVEAAPDYCWPAQGRKLVEALSLLVRES